MKREDTHEPFDIVVSVDAEDAEGYEIVGTRQIEDGLYEVILAKTPEKSATPRPAGRRRPRLDESRPKPAALKTPIPASILSEGLLEGGTGLGPSDLADNGAGSSTQLGSSQFRTAEPSVEGLNDSVGAPNEGVPSDSLNALSPDKFELTDTEPPHLQLNVAPVEVIDERRSSDVPLSPASDELSEIKVTDVESPKGPDVGVIGDSLSSSQLGQVTSATPPAMSSSPRHAAPSRPGQSAVAPFQVDQKAGVDRKGLLGRFNRKTDAAPGKLDTSSGAVRPTNPIARANVEIDPRTGRPVIDPAKPIVDASHKTSPSGSASTGTSTESPKGSSRRGRASRDDESVLRNVEPRPPSEFLDTLVANGLLSVAQLDQAHELRLKNGRSMFEALDELNFISEDRIASEVAKFYGLPVCDLPHEKLEPDALDLVPEQVAREHMAFPIHVSPDGLYVAVAEPSERLSGLLAQASGHTVLMAIAKASDVRWAMDSNYHALAGVAELVEEFEADEPRRRPTAPTNNTLDQQADNAPIVQVVNRILSQAMRDGASDVHIEPADDIVRVRNRVDGVLKVVLVLPAAMGLGLVSRIKIMANMNIVERRRPQDGKFTAVVDGREIDVRVATVATIWGETCVMRVLDKTRSVLSIDELGMAPDTHEAYSKLIRSPFGMVLCVGPTGSGKTTTLYASLTEISDVARNVMTIEDPVEYVFPSINQIQTNEQAGLTFATGLKSILRQDSDIVLVGEIRDVETAQIAVQSTLTGHFVLSSLHSTDAVSALTRFIDMGIESFLIASSVIAIVGQRLVRRMCSACKVPYTPSDEEMVFYTKGGGPKKEIFYHGGGCNFCGHTGFKERVGVYELLRMTPELKRLIVGFATEDELRDLARKQGMRSIQDEAINLVARDLTTSAEVVRSIYSL